MPSPNAFVAIIAVISSAMNASCDAFRSVGAIFP
jgi:hypothetical protein